MTAINLSERSQQREIAIEYEFVQSPKQVWRVLSEPELVALWLLPNDIAAEVGKRFKLGKQPGGIECEVLVCEPERLLSYSWRTDESGGDLDTVVTFVLTETDVGGTHLRLVHSGFPQLSLSTVAQTKPLSQHKVPGINSAANDSNYGVKMLWAA